MNSVVSTFVIVFTLVNILACVWLMWWTAKRRMVPSEDGKSGGDEPKMTGHVWDGDLQEYNNPLPRWWLWLFIITIVFGLAYLIIYPGLGSFAGVKKWTQVEQHAAEVADAEARLQKHLEGLTDKNIVELVASDKALRTARNLFGLHCSTCHGSDARGARGFPNLADGDWLWGGAPEVIYQSIAQGRNGVMPPWGAALGERGVEEVAAYVLSLSGRKVPEDMKAAGATRFASMCIACHGVDGTGNQALGAPNLADDVWLYGRTIEAVRDVIANGRANQMPPHEELLGEMKTKLLAAYVVSLSKQDTVATSAGSK